MYNKIRTVKEEEDVMRRTKYNNKTEEQPKKKKKKQQQGWVPPICEPCNSSENLTVYNYDGSQDKKHLLVTYKCNCGKKVKHKVKYKDL